MLHDSKWNYFRTGLGLERAAIRRLLDGVRQTRNSLAHFRDTLSADERDRLRFCVDWVSRVQQTLASVHAERPPVTPPSVLMMSEVGAPVAVTDESVVEADDVQVEDSRYAPLALYLKTRSPRLERFEMSFSQIEEIIRGRLPATARQHRSWWANDSRSHVQSRQWLEVGWRAALVSISEERVTFTRARDREQLYIRFFSQLQTELRATASFPLRNASPTGQSWSWICGVPEEGPQTAILAFSFALGGRFRVELYINRRDGEHNKRVFDALHVQRDLIEAEVGVPLHWERLDNKIASRIAAYHSGVITDDEKVLTGLRAWAVSMMVRFQKAMEPRLRDIVRKLEE
ncbi:MAG TPA: DUF4268 domain-containing protein [Archangium sp.]|nr:DUF4268 domain-containing protein [Archangium sp.]